MFGDRSYVSLKTSYLKIFPVFEVSLRITNPQMKLERFGGPMSLM